ncbi:hypothetical protein [Inconstantimicrobium porci]|uniref:hypothetical protein n=1 Tax=Inconstantimicrobium porci TaxID=2652291 RepID=UPI0024092107|nr:hypothetical protein [Inconstantimicrobium porci]MDD6769693.1 hypothetical protein [Inconstantimicrobium porci]
MRFIDVINTCKNIIDETDEDEQIDAIVKPAINYAYLRIATTVDKRTKVANINYSKLVEVPKDFASLVDIISGEDVLGETDYTIKANMIIFHEKFDNLKLIYSKTITPLVNDNDVLDIDDRYCLGCALYGCYCYFVYRKKVEVAQLLLSDWNALLQGEKPDIEVSKYASK